MSPSLWMTPNHSKTRLTHFLPICKPLLPSFSGWHLYFTELIKLGLIGVQKCALFANFHSKSVIICEEKCHNLTFWVQFNAQNKYYYNTWKKDIVLSSIYQRELVVYFLVHFDGWYQLLGLIIFQQFSSNHLQLQYI